MDPPAANDITLTWDGEVAVIGFTVYPTPVASDGRESRERFSIGLTLNGW